MRGRVEREPQLGRRTRRMRGVYRVVASGTVVLTIVFGSRGPGLRAEPPAAAKAVPTDEAAARERAKGHFKQGDEAFAHGAYRDALLAYTRAYETLPLPGFLFNIGQCHRNLGAHERAIYSFRLYLNQAPKAANREAVEALIYELEEVVAQQRTAPLPADDIRPKWGEPVEGAGGDNAAVDVTKKTGPVERASQAKPFYKTWWFWTAVGAVVVSSAAVGIYFGTRSSGAQLPPSPLPPWELP